MVGIAKEHEVVTQKMRIKKITFDSIEKGGVMAVKGKKKSKVSYCIFLS